MLKHVKSVTEKKAKLPCTLIGFDQSSRVFLRRCAGVVHTGRSVLNIDGVTTFKNNLADRHGCVHSTGLSLADFKRSDAQLSEFILGENHGGCCLGYFFSGLTVGLDRRP